MSFRSSRKSACVVHAVVLAELFDYSLEVWGVLFPVVGAVVAEVAEFGAVHWNRGKIAEIQSTKYGAQCAERRSRRMRLGDVEDRGPGFIVS